MDERTLRQALDETAARHDPGVPVVAPDVLRGRAAVRRRRYAAVGGGVVATALVLGGGVAVGQLAGAPAPSVGPMAPATSADPSPVSTPTPTPAPTVKAAERRERKRESARERAVREVEAQMALTAELRRDLYDLTAEHLDPQKRYLDYSSQSLQMSSSPDGTHTVGIKMGWIVPGEEGEGLVQVAVSDIPARPFQGIECGLHIGGVPCETKVLPSGVELEVGESASGAFDVVYRRPDGVSVQVLVDPHFGNNSLTALDEMSVSRGEVYRLVQDPRFEAPVL